ncbi:kinase-like protein, partial [Exidia glandulosa HHB12029]
VHGLAIVHGDIKGANILVSDNGVARLADFGITSVLCDYPAPSSTGAGTFRWMAPELLRDSFRLTFASDIWAFGCVILEASTVMSGKRPFYTIAQETQVILALNAGKTPDRPPGVPDAMWRLSYACFSEIPQERPSVEALLPRLEGFLSSLLAPPLLNMPIIPSILMPTLGLRVFKISRQVELIEEVVLRICDMLSASVISDGCAKLTSFSAAYQG